MPLSISDNIRAEMARKRMTEAQLGEHLKLTQRPVNRRLRGEQEWSATDLLTVAHVLGVDVATFYEGVEPATSSEGAVA